MKVSSPGLSNDVLNLFTYAGLICPVGTVTAKSLGLSDWSITFDTYEIVSTPRRGYCYQYFN